MYSDSDQESNNITCASQSSAKNNLLQHKSSQIYEKQYEAFMTWAQGNGVKNYDEKVFMTYFSEKAKINNPSTMWSRYSMLKATFMAKHNIDMSKFKTLLAFIKKQNQGYKPKKTKVFTRDDVNRFLIEAPDRKFLMWKVSLIIGLSGACRMDELLKMTTNQVEDKGNILIVTIPDSNTNSGKSRVFTVSEKMCNLVNPLDLYRKYVSLRPPDASHRRLFVSYRDGKCSTQPVGVHTLGKIPSYIAAYLDLPDSETYTGHAFKKTSAALMTDTSSDLLTLQQNGGAWKNSPMNEGYAAEIRRILQQHGKCANDSASPAPTRDMDENGVEEERKQILGSIGTRRLNSVDGVNNKIGISNVISASTSDFQPGDANVSRNFQSTFLEDSAQNIPEKNTSIFYLKQTQVLQKRNEGLQIELSTLKEQLSELTKVKQENEILKRGILRLRQENKLLMKKCKRNTKKTSPESVIQFVKSLQENREKCVFCTGLRFKDISALYKFLLPLDSHQSNVVSKNQITGFEQLVLVLVRLRTGLSAKALKRRFHISSRYLSHSFLVWVQHCYSKFNVLRPLMIPTRAKIQQHIPDIFQNLKNIKMIIDCAEFLSSESSYKVLLGCTPNGAVSFVSDPFEGSISDEELVRESNLFDFLEKDDLVLADRGFVVSYELERHNKRNICLKVSTFLNGGDQLTAEEEKISKFIAKQRVYIDHVVQRVKQFKILETLPLNMRGLLSQIVFVCACLVNFRE